MVLQLALEIPATVTEPVLFRAPRLHADSARRTVARGTEPSKRGFDHLERSGRRYEWIIPSRGAAEGDLCHPVYPHVRPPLRRSCPADARDPIGPPTRHNRFRGGDDQGLDHRLFRGIGVLSALGSTRCS